MKRTTIEVGAVAIIVIFTFLGVYAMDTQKRRLEAQVAFLESQLKESMSREAAANEVANAAMNRELGLLKAMAGK